MSLEITPGERIALAGGNGAGKSSLLRLLAGEKQDYTGTLTRASGLVVSYVPQCTDGLAGGLRTFAEGVDYSLFLTVLRKLGLDRMQFEKDMAGFSAGQKKKGAARTQSVRASTPLSLGRAAQLYGLGFAHADRAASG